MQVQRTAEVLQCAVAMRNWMAQHIPGAGSMPGHDLFLVLADQYLQGRPLRGDTLGAALPYPPALVAELLRGLAEAGLLQDYQGGADAALRPSARFVALLEQYLDTFESLMIPRHGLRAGQLSVQSEQAPLRQFATTLYDHFYDLGWLYLHQYGATCFMMAALVQRAAQASGFSARTAVCYVEVLAGNEMFLLGAEGYAGPGQVDGHAVCIVDETLLIDFGLGNLRRQYRRDFQWGVACDARPDPQASALAQTGLPNGTRLRWRDDWRCPQGEAQMALAVAQSAALFQQYQQRYA